MLAGSRTTYAHNRIMHLNDMHLSKVTTHEDMNGFKWDCSVAMQLTELCS